VRASEREREIEREKERERERETPTSSQKDPRCCYSERWFEKGNH
jgi:hypothetical protein